MVANYLVSFNAHSILTMQFFLERSRYFCLYLIELKHFYP